MEYVRLSVRNVILTTEAKLLLLRDHFTNFAFNVKNQFWKTNLDVSDQTDANDDSSVTSSLLQSEANTQTRTYCNYCLPNCFKKVSLKHSAPCHSFNCSAIVLIKKFISCFFNLICFPFLPCALILFPNSVNSCVNTSSTSFCSCYPKPCCLCFKNHEGGIFKLFYSPICCVILISIVFTLGMYVLITNSTSSLLLIDILLFFENLNQFESMFLFAVSFTVVSFPVMWGYVFFNLAAGYLYGFWMGLLVVIFSVTIGLTIAHLVCKRYFSNCVMNLLKKRSNFDQIEAILQVIDGSSGLKVVALTRLTPIPFGFQNGLFSVTNLSLKYYLLASDVGLLPTQILNCYIASKFRSFDQIVDQENPKGYLLFVFQIIIGLGLMVFVLQRARKELATALQHNDKTKNLDLKLEETCTSNVSAELTDVKCSQPTSNSSIQNQSNESKSVINI